MDTILDIARWQFGITTVYHFLFVPITIGLTALIAVMETLWLRTQQPEWLRLTKFFGRLFLINFAIGVVTGIVQEFQFGMNWSDYSRFVGDIFGAPLAIEGLLAFFLESTFLGLWIFGWDKLPRGLHAACMWLVHLGTLASSWFILAANSWMQHPVGYRYIPDSGRAEITDFWAVMFNKVQLVTFPHVILAAYMTAGAFMMGVAAYLYMKKGHEADRPLYHRAIRIGAVVTLLAGLGVAGTGDLQGKVMTEVQPMKMAAAEGLYETSSSCAPFSVFTVGTPDGKHEKFAVTIPCLLSFLGTGSFGGEVKDDKVFGRGSCDMKGGLAASIIAAEAFIDTYPDFSGAIEISATADEETGGYGGVAYLAEKGMFSPDRVQHVIIPEPLNKNRICLGHRGVWWAEIETHGRIAHGSMPFLGDSAIRHMGAVLTEMEATLFPALAEKRTAMPVVPPQARQSTLNINSIHGGQPEPEEGFTGFPAPVVAHSSRMIIDRRYLIEETPADVRQEMIDVLERVKAQRPTFQYEIRDLWTISPTMTERDAPIVTATSKAITEVLGIDPAYVVSPGTYDQKHIDRIGRMKNCIAYGPGILDLAHKPDEYVGVDDMIDSAKFMALTLRDLLGPRH